ncbi:PaREP1 family protein [Sulfurisphaera javensis]|uniref:PaREP1 family protein n=1 Tax=Sulfurisphaera javensis TaxID=2049879 RepID=A0AAT9GS34_9CREN
MKLPPTLINELMKMNIDEADITEIILSTFNVNEALKPKIYSELSKITLERSCEFLKQGNYDEAIDKLCKSVELIVRSIALSKGIKEAVESEANGRWTPTITEKVAEKIGLKQYLTIVYSFYEKQPKKEELEKSIETIKRIIINNNDN